MSMGYCKSCGCQLPSDAAFCPVCGQNVQEEAAMPPIPTASPLLSGTEKEEGLKAVELKCPTCGNPISQSDLRTLDWAFCKYCRKDFSIAGKKNTDEGIVERIFPTEATQEEFHQKCMQALMEQGERDIFDEMKDVHIAHKYFWVREFGTGSLGREIYPTCKYGKEVFKSIYPDYPSIPNKFYDKLFPTDKMCLVKSEYFAGAEIMSQELNLTESRYEYQKIARARVQRDEATFYCIPVFEETFMYKGKTYMFRSFGDKQLSCLHWNDMPKNDFLSTEPKYTSISPLLSIFNIVIWLFFLLIGVALGFRDGFWTAIIFLVIGGFILFYVWAIVLALLGWIPSLIDKFIQKVINGARRAKHRSKYKQIQEYKKARAKSRLGLNLTYEIPHFPIP